MSDDIAFVLDGENVHAPPGESIWQVARRLGVAIPHICSGVNDHYRADGNCRLCLVEIEGERTLAASCVRRPAPGMQVTTGSERAVALRNMVMELLIADHPPRPNSHDPDARFWHMADAMGVTTSRFAAREQPPPDASHPAMAVNLDACIQCNNCVRACREMQVNDVIGMAGRGARSMIVFDFADPMGESTCVACGECVQACPTGALMPAAAGTHAAERQVDSLCPYCGVGCQLTFHLEGEQIVKVDGRAGPANQNRLCVKGRFGFDYVHHPHRLTQPLVRKEGVAKHWDDEVDPADPSSHFRRASWKEAPDRAAAGLAHVRDKHAGGALAGFGSAKGSNEEAYLFQKLVTNPQLDPIGKIPEFKFCAARVEKAAGAGE